MLKRSKSKRTAKRAQDLTLSDAIIMPSGLPYEIRSLSWAMGKIYIETAVPNTGNARVERLYGVDPQQKLEVR